MRSRTVCDMLPQVSIEHCGGVWIPATAASLVSVEVDTSRRDYFRGFSASINVLRVFRCRRARDIFKSHKRPDGSLRRNAGTIGLEASKTPLPARLPLRPTWCTLFPPRLSASRVRQAITFGDSSVRYKLVRTHDQTPNLAEMNVPWVILFLLSDIFLVFFSLSNYS